MHPDKPDRPKPAAADRHLRLVVDNPLPQRRRTPRRQLVVNVAVDRRAADRRRSSPGVDGLLRTVLSDHWPAN